jgi:hypothetical protein
MILTCPACDTKYVVKDGAIPPGWTPGSMCFLQA